MTILLLAGLVGAAHVLAPDHWFPTSVLGWQRRWSVSRSLLFALAIYALHAAMGLAIYFAFNHFLDQLDSGRLLAFSVILVGSVSLVRVIRFPRIREVLGSGYTGPWGLFVAISLLGPAESLIPILIKSGHSGVGYLGPSLAFLAGTVAMGTASMFLGRMVWDKPMGLPVGINWMFRGGTVVPVLAGVAVGLFVLL